jgi:ectoine hydroxylase-related dioxygenase (phytanoyl-CoA dioxygenase family)
LLPHSIPFDLAHYESTGYGVVRQAVPAPQLAAMGAWLAHAEVAARQCGAEEQARDLVFEKDLSDAGRNGIPAAEVGDAIFILGDLCRYAPQFSALLQLPALVDACARALGSADLVAHFMNATTKHPGFGRGIGWHRDFPNGYLSGAGSRFLRVMVCLDGMAEHGGATRFIAGSHRVDDSYAAQEKRGGARHPYGAHHGVAAECAPGDLVLIHPRVVHGGPANTSALPRRNVIVQVGVAGMELVGERETVTGWPVAFPPQPAASSSS